MRQDQATKAAYCAGWRACMAGADGRYLAETIPVGERYEWEHGFLDAMDAEDGEQPDP